MSKRDIEEKIVFCMGPTEGGAVALIIGIPDKAWELMKGGKTHNLDLSSQGLPVKLVMFHEPTHDDCIRVIEQAAAAQGVPLMDERRRDFGIKDVPRSD